MLPPAGLPMRAEGIAATQFDISALNQKRIPVDQALRQLFPRTVVNGLHSGTSDIHAFCGFLS